MNLLITGAWSEAKQNIDTLEKMGHSVCFMQFENGELPCTYDWVEGVICNGFFLSHSIDKFVNLKYIQITSAGFDRVPMDYVHSHNIRINNARGVYSIPMAEFVFAGILKIYKHLSFFDDNQKNHVWKKRRDLVELYNKEIVIVGCGSVGTECAKRFLAFGCKVTGVDLYPRDNENYNSMVGLDELNNILPDADVVILTLPHTDETHHMMNKERFSLLKKTAIVVNIARGAVVNTYDLIDVLPQIGGAVIDVFEDEPLNSDSPLWEMENVIITPHNSFVGDANNNRLKKIIFYNLECDL